MNHNIQKNLTERTKELVKTHEGRSNIVFKGMADNLNKQLNSFRSLESSIMRAAQDAMSLSSKLNQNLIAQYADSMAAQQNIATRLLDSFKPPTSHLQRAIDQALQLTRSPAYFTHLLKTQSSLAQLSVNSPALYAPNVSKMLEDVFKQQRLWQSASVGSFAEQLFRQTQLQPALVAKLAEELKRVSPEEIPQVSQEELLARIEEGLEESGLTSTTADVATILNGLESWLNRVPPNLRSILIAVIAGIISGIVIMMLIQQPKSGDSTIIQQISITQQVKSVRMNTKLVLIEAGLPEEVCRNLRVVSKDDLIVFQAYRKDSPRVGKLKAGQVVTLKTKYRNWSEILWRDADSGQSHSGWVFTSYLKKL